MGEGGETVLSEARSLELAGSLMVDGCRVDYSSGSGVLVVTVVNTGTSPAQAVLYQGANRVELAIPAGASEDMEIPISDSSPIYFMDEDGCLGSFSKEYSDFRIVAEHVVVGAVDYVLATVFNDSDYAGDCDFTGTISCGPGTLDYYSGLYAASSEIGFDSIGKGSYRTFMILSEPGLMSRGVITVKVASDVTDRDLGNNTVTVSVARADTDGHGASSSVNGIWRDPILSVEFGKFVHDGQEFEGFKVTYKLFNEGLPVDSEKKLALRSMVLTALGFDEAVSISDAWKFSEDDNLHENYIWIPVDCGMGAGTYTLSLTFGNDRSDITLTYDFVMPDADSRIAWLDADGSIMHESYYVEGKPYQFPMIPAYMPENGDPDHDEYGQRCEFEGSWVWTDSVPEGYVMAYQLCYEKHVLTEVVRILSDETGKPFIGKGELYRDGGVISYSASNRNGDVYVGAKKVTGWALCVYEKENDMLKSVALSDVRWAPTQAIGLQEYLDAVSGSGMDGDFAIIAVYDVVDSGKCGDDLVWTLYADGSLSITGSGSMWDWSKASRVPWYAYKDSITSVSIEGATSVGKKAFYDYPSLVSVDLGSVESIGERAFTYCGITTLDLPETLKDVGPYAFYECRALTSLDLGFVELVGERAFTYCGITTLELPETLTYVGPYAFFGCPELTSLTIAGDDVVLDASAFSSCRKMAEIEFSGHGAVIGANAFYKNNGLRSVDLSTVAAVGSKAFPHCSGI